MTLLRFGHSGQERPEETNEERPEEINEDGNVRDLPGEVEDFADQTVSLKALDPSSALSRQIGAVFLISDR